MCYVGQHLLTYGVCQCSRVCNVLYRSTFTYSWRVSVQSCSYFTSFTFPLKLALKNRDVAAGNMYAMFKVMMMMMKA